MKSRIRGFALCLAGVVSLMAPVGAEAAVVTVGSTAAPNLGGKNEQPLLYLNARLGPNGGLATSPIDGTILRWRLEGFEGPFRLRVLTPNGGPSYTGAGTGATETVPDKGLHTYATNLPVKAGQTIGVESTGPGWFGAVESLGAIFAIFVPPLGDAATGNATVEFPDTTFTFSADVLPPPTVSAISPASGPIGGGAAVTISGANFIEVKGVSFGGVPAASFNVVNEGTITAVAPAGAAIGSVPVTVTTIAGTATSGQSFAYEACAVPKLRGRKLKGAKKAIRAGDCLVGKVRKRKGVTAKTGKVLKQRPKPGQVLPPGTKVNVKLG